MAVAAQRTLLALDEFAAILGMSPLFFNQMSIDGLMAPDGNPASVILQYSWQGHDKTGREEIASVIADAEADIARELNFSPGPTWTQDEFYAVTKPANPWLVGWNPYNGRGQLLAQQLNHGYFIQGGKETWTSLQAGSAVVYTASNASYLNVATITSSVGAGNPNGVLASEVAITYPGMGPGSTGVYSGEGYEIRPTNVTIDNTTGVVTIVANSAMFVQWNVLNDQAGGDPRAIDASLIPADMLATVDVYRHWTDPALQATFRWEPDGYVGNYGWFSCACTLPIPISGVCTACGYTTQTGCIRMRDRRNGLVTYTPGTYDATTGVYSFDSPVYCRLPDQMLLNYKHGLLDNHGQMPTEWKRAIAYLAGSRMDRPLSQLNQLEPFIRWLSQDRALVVSEPGGSSSRFQVDYTTTANPLGTTQAAAQVWRMIQRVKLGQTVGVH